MRMSEKATKKAEVDMDSLEDLVESSIVRYLSKEPMHEALLTKVSLYLRARGTMPPESLKKFILQRPNTFCMIDPYVNCKKQYDNVAIHYFNVIFMFLLFDTNISFYIGMMRLQGRWKTQGAIEVFSWHRQKLFEFCFRSNAWKENE